MNGIMDGIFLILGLYCFLVFLRAVAHQLMAVDRAKIRYKEYKALQAIAPEKWRVGDFDELWMIFYRNDGKDRFNNIDTEILAAKNWFHWKMIKWYDYRMKLGIARHEAVEDKERPIRYFKQDLEEFKKEGKAVKWE